MPKARWRELLERRLAGERTEALADEYGVSVSTIHWQANRRRMRKRDHADAVFLPKGPPPVVLVMGADGTPRLVCAEMAFVLDPYDPVATTEAILKVAVRVAATGNERRTGRLMRLAGQSMKVIKDFVLLTETWPTRKTAKADGGGAESGGAESEGEEAPRPAHVLRPAQRPPVALADGSDWRTWLFLGGRGAGKTLAGAEWLADQAERLGSGGRLALIGPTLHDVREVMIEGVSGLRSLPRWTRATRPVFQPSRRRLYFANGCVAYAFSAEDPDSLRGPQFSAAWADEFCAWRGSGPRGAAETLAMLRLGLRLPLAPSAPPPAFGRSPSPQSGEETGTRRVSSLSRSDGEGDREAVEGRPAATHPRLLITTTPRPTRALVRLRDEAGCALTHAGTLDNAAHLSPGFVDDLKALYGGTKRAAQELEGQVVELDGALFTAAMMAAARFPGGGSSPEATGWGPYERVVVAIDPTATARGDACGLIAAASYRGPDGVRHAVILADRSIAGLGPDAWARRAVALAEEFGASALVAEVNQGGDMVKAVLKTAGATLKIREVHATRGKYIRAEPVAALYEQGRIHHAGAFEALEEELMAFGGEMEAAGSLDRADALVWAVTDLLIDAPDGERGPRARWL